MTTTPSMQPQEPQEPLDQEGPTGDRALEYYLALSRYRHRLNARPNNAGRAAVGAVVGLGLAAGFGADLTGLVISVVSCVIVAIVSGWPDTNV